MGDDGLTAIDALHAGGMGFKSVQTPDEDDRQVWICTVPTSYQDRLDRLRAELGDEAFETTLRQLQGEAQQLWLELGYTDG